MDPTGLDTSAGAVDDEIDAAERLAPVVGLHDRHAVHFVGDGAVGVPGDDRVDEPPGQRAHHVEHLGGTLARGEVGRVGELRADPPGVRGDDHDTRAPGAQRRGLRRNRCRQRRHREPVNVGRQGHRQCAGSHHPDDAHRDPRGVDHHRRPNVRPRHGSPGGFVDEVGGQERKPRLCGPGLEGAAQVGVAGGAVPRVDGAVLEVVVADGRRGVAERVVGVDDQRALRQVGFDAPLIGIAGVDEEHGAAIGGARGSQVRHVAAEQREAALPAFGEDAAVQVGRADDRQRDAVRLDAGGRPCPAAEGERQRDTSSPRRKATGRGPGSLAHGGCDHAPAAA